MALEPRILFDGAMLVTAVETDGEQPATTAGDTSDVMDTTDTTDADTGSTEIAATEETEDAAAEERTTTDTDASTDDDTDLATEPAPSARNEVVFVDGRVSDPGAFTADGREVVVLSTGQDGLTQIANALAGRTGVDAIHIVGHGSDGQLLLGSSATTADTIQTTQLASLQLIGQALSADGDILIYACDYAAGADGLQAMDLIADITGADVAASTDATGHESLGGDWALEQSTGEIEAQSLDMASWEGELPAYSGDALAANLTLSGSATAVAPDTIRLTPNAGNQSGGAQSSFEIDLTEDFSLSFSVFLGTSDAGADGVTFIMHNDPDGAQALGDMGGGLGAMGIANGVVIEFDTYNNGGPDLANDHTSVWDSDSGEVIVAAQDLGNIENGTWYPVEVSWDAATETLSYSFNGVSMGSTSGLLSAGRFGSGNTVHFGWTAATGGAMNEQAVRIDAFTGEINFAPVAVDDSFTVSEDGSTLLGQVLANDSDPEGGALSATPLNAVGSAGGSLGTDDSGNLVFIPGPSFDDLAAGETRDTSFTYTLHDEQGATATATITVTVQGANDAPDAQDDHYDVTEDGAYTLGSVRANDSDIDSSELWAEINTTEGSNGGTFTQDDAGNLIFIPGGAFDDLAAGETRDTSFSYVLHDSEGGQSSATVTVTVHGVNDAPVAEADQYVASEDAAMSLGRVTVNDWDVDGSELWADTSATGAGDQGGFFSFDDSGGLVFNPGPDFDDLGAGESRDTQFAYTLYDDLGASTTGTVTVTVLGANDNPVAQDDSFEADADTLQSLGSLTGNDSDADGDELQVVLPDIVAGSTGGRFWLDDSGSLIFDANGDFDDLAIGESRETSLTYSVTDGLGGSSEATVTVTVHGVATDPAQEPPPQGGDETGVVPESPSYPNQIVFVDARVPDPQAFALDGRELVILSTETDGLDQIASALAGRTGIEAIHIVSHGSEGTVTLGLGDINAGNVQAGQIQALQTIAQSLTVEADILIYACEFAGGQDGLNAMLLLSQYTQADVAASLFVTGSPSLGGNWSLEATVGSVEAGALAPQNWNHLLDVPQQAPVVQRAEATPVAKRFFLTPTDAAPQERSAEGLRHMHTAAEPRSLSLESSAANTGHTPVWPVERPQIWSTSQPWLEELAVGAEAEADDTPQAAPGLRAQLSQWAQWGMGRPLTRAAVRA
jgi:VCBS repeat-containing protein